MRWLMVLVLLGGCTTGVERQAQQDALQAACGDDWGTIYRGLGADTLQRCFTSGRGYVEVHDQSVLADGTTVDYYHAAFYDRTREYLIRVENDVVTSWTKWDS